jgi:hypothetical protein
VPGLGKKLYADFAVFKGDKIMSTCKMKRVERQKYHNIINIKKAVAHKVQLLFV